eukprot:scaffold44366_cov54-Phaeocystis_antarctica.AAC.1
MHHARALARTGRHRRAPRRQPARVPPVGGRVDARDSAVVPAQRCARDRAHHRTRGHRPTLARMHRIAIIAYGSLGSSSNKASVGSGVAQVAARHGVSSAALLLRWALARGAAVIPGATSAAHIRENLAARRLRFELSPEDEAIIAGDAKPPGWKLWPNMGRG